MLSPMATAAFVRLGKHRFDLNAPSALAQNRGIVSLRRWEIDAAHGGVRAKCELSAETDDLSFLTEILRQHEIDGDVDGWVARKQALTVSMLADDARMTMPPLPSWYVGRDQIAVFLRQRALARAKRWRLLSSSANGQPAQAAYLWDEQAGVFAPHSLLVLTLRERSIQEITAFVTPEAFERFGLPEAIAH